jgi:sporulation protein YlmC with PRC-barrel domain
MMNGTISRRARVTAARLDGRAVLLAGAAALALGYASAALAQQQGGQGQTTQAQPSTAPGQQPGSQQPVVVGQLRTAEQALRQAQGQLSGSQQPNFAQARTAVDAGLTVIGRVPQQVQGQDVWRNAQRELNEAQQALQGQQPNQQQIATRLREAADALGTLAGRVGGSADAGAGSASAGQQRVAVQGSQPQVSVQQPAPQVTVQQPQAQITVTQPPPQVTIQQPEPRVTVQQAQPQVRVQQAEPQVTVQQQGQPQVTVQGQDRQRQAQGSADQRTGATLQAPAPAQSSGARPQQAATSPATGVSLQSVQNLVGKNVVGSNGRDAGEIRNLLIDNSGRVRAAVIEWGGFLGLGERQAMVPVERIRLGEGENDRAQLNMTREELEALPRYDRDRIAGYGRERGWGEGLRLYR